MIEPAVLLGSLRIGDKFIPLSKLEKAAPIYQVIGEPEFNARHGSATRRCKNLSTNQYESKSCRFKVVVKK